MSTNLPGDSIGEGDPIRDPVQVGSPPTGADGGAASDSDDSDDSVPQPFTAPQFPSTSYAFGGPPAPAPAMPEYEYPTWDREE